MACMFTCMGGHLSCYIYGTQVCGRRASARQNTHMTQILASNSLAISYLHQPPDTLKRQGACAP
eukprot:420760-Pelagomonas_calceolata.AAC.1